MKLSICSQVSTSSFKDRVTKQVHLNAKIKVKCIKIQGKKRLILNRGKWIIFHILAVAFKFNGVSSKSVFLIIGESIVIKNLQFK